MDSRELQPMKCLRSLEDIGNDRWGRTPACHCQNCVQFFNRCRDVGMKQAYKEVGFSAPDRSTKKRAG